MNPAVARPGRSFKGLVAYLTHDPDHAKTDERVDFALTRNLRTNDPAKAAKVMAWTALHADDLKLAAGEKATGRKMKNPVYHFIQTWSKEEAPSHDEMMKWVDRALQEMKFEEHETVIVGHNDSEHHQIHVAVNRVHPVRGTSPSISNDYNRLQAIAYEYEKERGKILCPARIAKFEKDPELRRAGRKALQARRAAEKAGTMAKKSKARPVWERDKAARLAALNRQAAEDATKQDRELYRATEIEPPDDPVKEIEAFKAQQAEEAQRARAAREQLDQDERRQKFEEWEITQRNNLQNCILEERGRVGRENTQLRDKTERYIEEHYGQGRRNAQRELAALKQRQEKGSRLSRFVDRLRGLDQDRDALVKNLASIAMREMEVREATERRVVESLEILQKREAAEKQKLEAAIARRFAASLQIPNPANNLERDVDQANQKNKKRGLGFN